MSRIQTKQFSCRMALLGSHGDPMGSNLGIPRFPHRDPKEAPRVPPRDPWGKTWDPWAHGIVRVFGR